MGWFLIRRSKYDQEVAGSKALLEQFHQMDAIRQQLHESLTLTIQSSERLERSYEAHLAAQQQTIDSLHNIIRDQSMALLNGPADQHRQAVALSRELAEEAAANDPDAASEDDFRRDLDAYLTPTSLEAPDDVVWLDDLAKETDG